MSITNKIKDNYWFKNWDSNNIKHLVNCSKVFSKISKYQKIEVLDSKIFGRILTLDNQIQIATKFNSYVHESLIHPAMLTFRGIKDILIIGGGDGFSLKEILKYSSVRMVDLIEIDEQVVKVSKRFFPEVKKYFNDKRVFVNFMDGTDFVKNAKRSYDLIVLDISDPKGVASKIFTLDFLKRLKGIMRKRSVLITHCESPDSAGELYYRIIETFRRVFDKVSPFRVWIPHYIDFWGRLVASDHFNPLKLSIKEIERRIKNHKLILEWLTPKLFYSIFRSFSKDIIKESLSKHKILTIKDNLIFSRS